MLFMQARQCIIRVVSVKDVCTPKDTLKFRLWQPYMQSSCQSLVGARIRRAVTRIVPSRGAQSHYTSL